MKNSITKAVAFLLFTCFTTIGYTQIGGLSGPSSVSVGTTANYNYGSSPASGTTYSWSVSGGGVLGSVNFLQPHTREVTWNGSGTVSVTVTNSFGSNTYSKNVSVICTVPTPTVPSQSACGSSVTLTVSGSGTYQWFHDNSGSGIPISNGSHMGVTYSLGLNGRTLTLSNYTGSETVYVRETQSCGNSGLRSATATLNPVPTLASGSNQARCGSGTVSLSASPGNNANTIRWYSSASGGTLLHTGTSYTTPSLSSSTTYYAASYNSSTGCQDSDRKAITAVIDAPTVAGTVSGNSNRCGSGSHSLSISGHTGTIQRWQSRYRNGSGSWTSWSTITETDNVTSVSPTLSQWNSGVRTYEIRAVVKSGTCNASYPKKTVTVDPSTVGGTVSANSTRCGSGSHSFSLSGHTGTIQRWQSRYRNGSGSWTGWSTVTETDNVTNVSPTLSQWSGGVRTYEVRAVVKSGSCSTSYPKKTVTVDRATVAGTVSANSTRCGSGSHSFSLSGHTGTIQRWESRYRNGSGGWTGWSTVTETDNVTSVSPTLSQWNSGVRTYEVRAVVKSGTCSASYPKKTVTVDPSTVGGTVSANSTLCGSGNHSFSISGYTGTIQRWESRYKNGSGSWTSWSTITETDNVTSVNPTLSQWSSGVRTYEVRAVVKSGTCSTSYPKKTVTVDQVTVGGSVSASNNRCGTGGHSFSISGHTGTIQRWQSRYKDGLGNWTGWSTFEESDNVTSVSPTLNQWNGGVRTYQIQAVVKSGSCSAAYPKKSVTIDPATVGGTISASNSRCGSGNHSFSISGHTGTIQRWQSRYRNGSGSWTGWSTITETDNVTSINPNLTQWSSGVRTYEVRAVVKSGSCNTIYPIKTVSITPLTGSASISSGVSTRCQGGGTTDYNASASNANSYSWSISPSSAGSINSSGTVSWNSGFSGTATVSVTANGTCNNTTANRTVTITPLVGAASMPPGGTLRCQGSGTTDYDVSATNATSYSWAVSPSAAGTINSSGTVTWNNDFSGTATVTATANGTCNSTTVNRTVNVTPLTGSVTISSGVSSRCQGGGSTDYNASAANANSYTWAIIPSSAGTINSSGTVSWNSSFSGTATVSVTANGSCNNTSANRTVTVTPLTGSPTISSGVSSRCQGGGSTDYNVSASNADSYSWSISPSGAGTINTSGTVSWNSGFSGTATVTATANGSCNNTTANQTVTVTPLTGSVTISSGVSNRCEGGGTTDYNASATNANSYSWTISPISAGTINSSGTVSWNSTFTGTATVSVTANGSCNNTTADRTVTVTPLTGPVTISGGVSSRCQEGGTTDFNASATNENSYSWAITPSSAGSINNSGTVSWNSSFFGTATVSVTANGSCNNTSDTQTVTVVASTVGGTLGGGTEEFGVASGTLGLSGQTGSIVKWQYNTSGTWIDIANTTAQLDFTNVQTTTQYRALVKNGICNEVESSVATVTILNIPSVDLGITQNIRPGRGTILSTDAGHANYAWYKDGTLIPHENTNQLEVNHPGSYHVTVTSGGGATYTTGDAVMDNQLEINENAVLQYTYRIPLDAVTDPFQYGVDEQNISAQIYDGLGRAVQSVALQASPLQSDMVTPMTYDDFGRQTHSYLAYPDADLNVLSKANAIANQATFYQNEYNTAIGYAESKLELSPLSRVLEQGAPGDDWQIGSTHTVMYTYDVADVSEVRRFDGASILSNPAHYGTGDLFKEVVRDEDQNETVTYTNKEGQMVMKKSETGDVNKPWAETYYVYDQYGNLTVVLPPEASDRLQTEFVDASNQAKTDFLNTWAFQYEYDYRERMIMKKVPGAEKVLMVYDEWNRLVLTQDGEQRKNNQWLFTKYDQLNRPIMTGIMNGGNIATVTPEVDEANQRLALADGTNTLSRYEDYLSTGVNQYTDQSFPGDASVDQYLTVTYYDNYLFMNADWTNEGLAFTNPTGLTQNTAVKGQVTGTMTKVGDGSISTLVGGWIRSVSYYDDKYRVIQTQSTNHLGGKDAVTNYYDFVGQVTRSISTHNDGTDTNEITRRFEYDHVGRLTNTYHQMNTEPEVLIASNDYDELGQLIEKDLHGETGGASAQSLDYDYNIRGWLTSINSSDLTASVDGDLFGMELYYNTNPLDIANTNFNGNISAMRWSDYVATGTAPTRSYSYDYDKLNRLTNADHHINGVDNDSYDVKNLSYDLNGNMLSLERYGASNAVIDNLDYNQNLYVGNQLMRVTDLSSSSEGFKDGTNPGDDYEYDDNGNMIKDLNKEIVTIRYNHLNLPVEVIMNDTEGAHQDRITYLYDAAGIKLRQSVYDNEVLVKTTDYVGEYIYETEGTSDRNIALIQHEEGRLIPQYSASQPEFIEGYDYQYHLKDHLGNVRLTFSTTPEEFTMVETFETGESNGFQDLHRHTNASANTTVGGDEVERLQSGQTGAMVFLSLNKGDTVDLSIQANYENAPTGNTFLGTAFTTLFTTFDSNFGSGAEGGGVSSSNTVFEDALDGTEMAGKGSSSTAPRAYLNYLLFDKDMNYLNAGFEQISTAALGVGVHETISINDIIADQQGYILAYLSNENSEPVDVNWDDFTVTQRKTNIVSTQDYYPFGLTFNESVRVASEPNSFKYNSFELLDDHGINLYDYQARYYDPAIGRFINVDPAANLMRRHSPYNYAVDNPIRYIDPDGMMPDDMVDGSEVEHFDGVAYGSGSDNSEGTEPSGTNLNQIDPDYLSIKDQIDSDFQCYLYGSCDKSKKKNQSSSGGVSEANPGVGIALRTLFTIGAEEILFALGLSSIGSELERLTADETDRRWYHYTDVKGFAGILETGTIYPNSKGKVYLADDAYAAGDAFTRLFLGQETHKDRGNYVIVFTLDRVQESNLVWDPNNPLEYTHFGSVKPVRILYEGPNPFGK